MIHFLSRRLLLTVPVLLGVATPVFSLIHLVPGDPVQAMLGESAPPQDIAEMRGRLGLDRPLHAQYGAFLKGLGTGNLGSSLRTNQPVTAAIAERLRRPSSWRSRPCWWQPPSPFRSGSSRRFAPARTSTTPRRRWRWS